MKGEGGGVGGRTEEGRKEEKKEGRIGSMHEEKEKKQVMRKEYATLRSGMQGVRGPPFRSAADVYGTATT